MAFLDYTGLSYFFDKLKLLFATKTEVAGKADSSHAHVGTEVTLTGYSKASSVAAVAATDTVNAAFGKVQKSIEAKADASHSHVGSEVTLTGYAKASSASAVAATDTVNVAFGKVQKTLDGKQNTLTNMTSTELDTGTATTARSISAKVIADYVAARLAELVDSAPGTLDTLNELAAALGDDPSFATTIAGQIAAKADASHSHVGTEVTLTGYSKASSASAVAATDTANAAIGKLEKALDGKAGDSGVVHNTGTEDVGGNKTFTSDIRIKEATASLLCLLDGLAKGTAPQSDVSANMRWYDGSGTQSAATSLGGPLLSVKLTGEVIAGIAAFKNAAGSTDNAGVYVVYPASGSPYATAPSTPATGNDTDIVTRDYVGTITTTQIDTLFL